MNYFYLFITLFLILSGFDTSCAATYKSIDEWEKCRDRAVSSVDQQEVGMTGVEYTVNKRCGNPPVKELNTTTGSIGVRPYDLVRSKVWKKKFVELTKDKYRLFLDRLQVSSVTELEGDWIVGDGLAPHSGGSDEAALAINTKSGEVYAAMLIDTKKYVFGFESSSNNAPMFLKNWLSER